MNHYFISGTSSGIGLSLAKKLCDDGLVTGISRTNNFVHPNFTFVPLDLNEPLQQTAKFSFTIPANCTRAILINNAGTIGDIRRVSKLDPQHFLSVMNVNFTSLAILSSSFIRAVEHSKCDGLILNISSGAATHPIASWATYCASKAAVDLFSATINEEMKQQGNTSIKCHSVYPGIIDTPMQEHIRASETADFPDKIRFEEYKKTGQLASPDLVAEKIIAIFKGSSIYNETIINLREH